MAGKIQKLRKIVNLKSKLKFSLSGFNCFFLVIATLLENANAHSLKGLQLQISQTKTMTTRKWFAQACRI